jgi:hypothetical protein
MTPHRSATIRAPDPVHPEIDAMTDTNPVPKIEQPATHFTGPHEVVVDPALSPDEKGRALDTLEQDARQLAEASNEGMAGGEATGLREVLRAKDALELTPIAQAYRVVMQDLHARQCRDGASEDGCILFRRAVEALEAVRPFLDPDAADGAVH